MNIIHLRWIGTSAKLQGTKLIGPVINKVFNFETTKKKKRILNTQFTPVNLNIWKPEGNKPLPNKRLNILNRIFMRYITDLMATGSVAPKLLGRGIEISDVKMTNGLNIINVYWTVNKEDIDVDTIQEILNASTGHLQHELSQLQVISKVPIINFVKDKKLFFIKKLEAQLSTINLENQYDVKESLEKELNEITVKEDDSYEITLPEIKQNVLGFDHSIIMKKIKTSMKKAQNTAICKVENVSNTSIDNQKIEVEVPEFVTKKEQDELFKKFLKTFAINAKRNRRGLPRERITNRIENLSEISDDLDDDSYNDIEINEEYKYDDSE